MFTMTHRKGKKWNKQNIGLHAKKTKECLKRSTRANIYFVLRGWRSFSIVCIFFVCSQYLTFCQQSLILLTFKTFCWMVKSGRKDRNIKLLSNRSFFHENKNKSQSHEENQLIYFLFFSILFPIFFSINFLSLARFCGC